MAEYYAVLSKAVSGLETSSLEARRAVYDKARNALIGQLKAINPPLPPAEISRQRLELEEAIRKIERESASRAPADSATTVAHPPEPPPRPDVIRRPPANGEGASPGPSTPVQRAAPVSRPSTNGEAAADRRGIRPERPSQPAYVAPRSYPAKPASEASPRLVPEYEDEPETLVQSWPEETYAEPRARSGGGEGRGRRRSAQGDDTAVMERRARPSRLPAILLMALIVVMVGGLAALGWSQRAVVQDLLAIFDSGSGDAAVSTNVDPAETPSPASTKNADRLMGAEPAGSPVRVVDAPPASGQADSPAMTQNGGQMAMAPPTATALQSAAQPDAGFDFGVPQKATLYEEPQDQAAAAAGVVAISGSVTWGYLANGADGPEITANVDVPERNMKIGLTFRRNIDTTLPASHLVEVVIDTPAEFPGQGIENVPRLVLKTSETAQRGQPLIGATAAITDGFFWIALSGVDSDVAANLTTMRGGGWIDVPMVYKNGQRAILTIAKGAPGEKAFELALASWTASAAAAAPSFPPAPAPQ